MPFPTGEGTIYYAFRFGPDGFHISSLEILENEDWMGRTHTAHLENRIADRVRFPDNATIVYEGPNQFGWMETVTVVFEDDHAVITGMFTDPVVAYRRSYGFNQRN